MGIDCFLNDQLDADAQASPFRVQEHKVTIQSYNVVKDRVEPVEKKIRCIWDTKKKEVVWHPQYGYVFASRSLNRISCCGISELTMLPLGEVWMKYRNNTDKPLWKGLVATYLKEVFASVTDQRVVISGLPVQVGRNSSYNAAFYKSLIPMFTSWGFVQVNKTPYVNNNSHNKIVVMMVRLNP